MPCAHLMSDHRRFTGGEAVIEVEGDTVGAVIAELERRYPGLGDMLTNASSAGVKSFLMLKVFLISSGVFPLIMLATVLQVTSNNP